MCLTVVIAGGGAGMMEALACHPLGKKPHLLLDHCVLRRFTSATDTIKVRMQLSKRARAPGVRRS
jgi:solute carrier family 25 (mitochondrial citrate transporter), member 1